jgi:small GTP-binding protein
MPSSLPILLLGDASVGKTSLVKRWVTGEFDDERPPTVGSDTTCRALDEGGNIYELEIIDVSGQEQDTDTLATLSAKASGAMIVFDLSNGESFAHLPKWIAGFQRSAPKGTPFVFVGSKSDRPNPIPDGFITEFVQQFAGVRYFQTSAKEETGIDDAFVHLVEVARENNPAPAEPPAPAPVPLESPRSGRVESPDAPVAPSKCCLLL